MPLWRRSHDHRRDLRAQRRTPRPAIAQSRAQDRDAMTPITAFVALPARREPRFRCRIAAMLAGIPVKNACAFAMMGLPSQGAVEPVQDLETFLSVIYTACPRLNRSSVKS